MGEKEEEEEKKEKEKEKEKKKKKPTVRSAPDGSDNKTYLFINFSKQYLPKCVSPIFRACL